MLTSELDAKRIDLLREMIPSADVIGALMDPSRPDAAAQLKSVQAAAQAIGRQLAIASAGNQGDFDTAFDSLVQQDAQARHVVAASPLFTSRRDHLVALTAHHAMPTMFQFREFTEAGGLVGSAQAWTRHTVKPASTSAEYTRAKSRPNCRSCNQRNLNWS